MQSQAPRRGQPREKFLHYVQTKSQPCRQCSDSPRYAAVDFRVADLRTVLHALASSGTLESTQAFLKYPLPGLDAESRDNKGNTAWELFENRVGKPEGMREAFSLLLDHIRTQALDDEEGEEQFVDAFDDLDVAD